ncbi:hypothetical protein Daus18300_001198 [Diaporthe australafricana]|uniref:Protein kinase domain-containing protein n=1 Tax=Diaporthe australafricana TaxID=127596 RepID=A0ABR3Y0A8_9PEZI
MGDAADGWHTVMPTSHHGHGRLSRPQVEEYELQSLKEWTSSTENWSGMGKHITVTDYPETKTKVHARFKTIENLGATRISVVEKVHYSLQSNKYPICLARKWIRPRRGRTLEMLRDEAEIMERLDHKHIIKLVGTYSIKYNELYLLIWPVAVCDLSAFLDDIENLRHGQGDFEDIVSRFEALGLGRPDGNGGTTGNGLDHRQYLHQIIGCITQATAFCHRERIRHLDLKPSNILLAPGRVYLADFGVAKDVEQRDHTHTLGKLGTPKWQPPEMSNTEDEWSMKKADVYTLGLVHLNILAILYHANMSDFEHALCDDHPVSSAGKFRRFLDTLAALALASQDVKDPDAATLVPKHIVRLVSEMVSRDPESRPDAGDADKELVRLGGIHQIYHSPCCKRSDRYVTELLDNRQREMATKCQKLQEKNGQLSSQLRELKAKDETYEKRIQDERDRCARSNKLLEDERRVRKQLEDQIAAMQYNGARRRPGPARQEKQFQEGLAKPKPRYAERQQQAQYTSPGQQASSKSHITMSGPKLGNELRPVTATAQPRTPSALPVSFASAAASPVINKGDSKPSRSPRPEAVPRRSISRLPLATNPATPIRSRAQTPTLNRDSSLTDSTQYSMTSSILSRLSVGTKDTSVSPSPAMGWSPLMNRDDMKPTDRHWMLSGAGLGISGAPFEHMAEGASDWSLDGVESGSVRSSGPVAAHSPAPSPSPLSPMSPQSSKNRPSMPTAKSWADVARKRQQRGVRAD